MGLSLSFSMHFLTCESSVLYEFNRVEFPIEKKPVPGDQKSFKEGEKARFINKYLGFVNSVFIFLSKLNAAPCDHKYEVANVIRSGTSTYMIKDKI